VAVQSFPYLFFFSNQLADDVNTCVDAAQPAPYLKIEGPLYSDMLQCMLIATVQCQKLALDIGVFSFLIPFCLALNLCVALK
jgi:hypothetical protein